MDYLLTQSTRDRLMRMLSRQDGAAPNHGHVRGGVWGFVRCDSITPVGGNAVLAQCYPGTILTTPTQEPVLSATLGSSVLLTLLGDSGNAVAPRLNGVYECLIGGEVESDASGSIAGRPRAFGTPATVYGSGTFRHVPRWVLAGDGLEDTGVTIGRGALTDGGNTNLCVWFEDNTFAVDTAFIQFAVDSQASGSYTPPTRFGATRIYLGPQGSTSNGNSVLIQATSGSTTAMPEFLITSLGISGALGAAYRMDCEGDQNYGKIDFATNRAGLAFAKSNIVVSNSFGFHAGITDDSNTYLPSPYGGGSGGIDAWLSLHSNSPAAGNKLVLHGATAMALETAFGVYSDLLVAPGDGLAGGTYP